MLPGAELKSEWIYTAPLSNSTTRRLMKCMDDGQFYTQEEVEEMARSGEISSGLTQLISLTG
jgi:hypothetical protein